jgi:DNA-binding transcriptional ArsR family regulator
MMTDIDQSEFIQKSSDVAEILKTMGHPKRLLILCLLRDGEKSVSEIEVFCQISQSQVSNFLKRMMYENLVENRRDGNTIYYKIKDPRISELVQQLQNIFC